MYSWIVNAINRLKKRDDAQIPRQLQAFLPPALEVLDSPPSPAPRVLTWLLALLLVSAIVWGVFGKMDIITTAEGKIIPDGRVKVIQAFDRGMVKQIWVVEAQKVAAGDPLIELDQTQTSADAARLAMELDFAKRRLARQELLLAMIRDADTMAAAERLLDAGEGLRDHPEERQWVWEAWRRQAEEVATLRSQAEERRAEQKAIQVSIRQLGELIPLSASRLEAMEPLYERNHVSKLEYLAVVEEGIQRRHALEAEQAREEQVVAALATLERQLAAHKARTLTETLAERDDARRQRDGLEQELTKVADLNAKQIITSPVDGTVKGLAVHTIGGVVNPAEVLMEIVPIGERLEVEVFIGNQDIGYVMEGQTAEVKIHTFPFTKYGLIDGTVESVARDATVDENLGLIYRARLQLARSTLMVDGKETELLPGMGVTAEIATGERRLIEFFLAPLLRARQESLRER